MIPIGDIAYGEDDYGLNSGIVEIPHDDGDDLHLIEKATEIGFESYYFVVNMGTLLFAFILSMIVPLFIFCLLKPCASKSRKINNRSQKIAQALRGNIFIRYIIEANLDICLCLVLQIEYNDVNGGLNFDTTFAGFNTVMTVVLGLATAFFLPFTVVFFTRNFMQWEDHKFKERYGAFYDGLRTDRKSSALYHIFFIIRRISFTLVAIYAS